MFQEIVLTLCFLSGTSSNLDVRKYEAQLGSDDFREREQATKVLRSYGSSARSTLLALKKSSDPEVRRRADYLNALIYNRILNQFEPYPEIDTLYYRIGNQKDGFGYDFSAPLYNLARGYIECAENRYNYQAPCLAYWRYPTRLWFRDLLDSGTSEWQLWISWTWMHVIDQRAGYGYWDTKLRKKLAAFSNGG